MNEVNILRTKNTELLNIIQQLKSTLIETKSELQKKDISLNQRYWELSQLTLELELSEQVEKKLKLKNVNVIQEQQYGVGKERNLHANVMNSNKRLLNLRLECQRKIILRNIRTYLLSINDKFKIRTIFKNKNTKQLELYEQLIKLSGFFDEAWYISQYKDVRNDPVASKSVIKHYVVHGGFEMRNPSEFFDSEWYLEHYPDVTEEGLNPLVHYLLFGIDENRSIMSIY